MCKLGSPQTCLSRETEEKALFGITPDVFPGTRVAFGQLRQPSLDLSFVVFENLKALPRYLVKVRIASKNNP